VIRVAIATLGCKTNAFESSAIAGQFGISNHIIVPFDDPADIYIINTCTVTGRTDFKSRNLIRKALKRKEEDPSIRIVVTGCFAQRNPDEIRQMGEIDLIVDNQNKQDIAQLLDSLDYQFTDIMAATDYSFRPVLRMVEHSRAFQKIQDGCDFRCAYCAIPYGRGNSRSASIGDIITQAKLFVDSGYREIVLGGVNLGLYRDGNNGLAEVVEALQRVEGLELIRLSSLEPMLVTSGLLARLRSCSKLCPHFHLALQSGCDSVLKRMGRRQGTAEFKQLVSGILSLWPDAAIGLDVITGFPGETETEFDTTHNFLRGLDIAYLHVFSFSRRPGTPAAEMSCQIPNQEKSRRTSILTGLSTQKKEAYKQKLIQDGIPLSGVCESIEEGLGTCLSDHYIRAYKSGGVRQNEVFRIIPRQLHRDGLI